MDEPLSYATSVALPSRPLRSGLILALLGLSLIAMAGGFFLMIERYCRPPSFDGIAPFDTQAVVNAKLAARASITWTWHQTMHVSLLYACALGCLAASVVVLTRSVRKLMMA